MRECCSKMFLNRILSYGQYFSARFFQNKYIFLGKNVVKYGRQADDATRKGTLWQNE